MQIEQSLIAAHIAKNGPPRRFESGVSASFEYCNSYLQQFGMRLRMQSWRCHISQNGGTWRPILRQQVLQLVDEFRALEGLEPLKAVRG